MCRLNNMILKSNGSINKERIRKYLKKLKIKYNFPKSLVCTKAILGGRFIAIQVYLKKQEKCQINTLSYHVKELSQDYPVYHNAILTTQMHIQCETPKKGITGTKSAKGRNNKDQSRNKYDRPPLLPRRKRETEIKGNQELIFRKERQN